MARRRYGTFTPRRRQALRKAQLISARKRKGHGRITLPQRARGSRGGTVSGSTGLSRRAKVGIAAGIGTGLVLGGAIAAHKQGYVTVKPLKAHNRPKVKTEYTGPITFSASGFRTGGGTRTTVTPFQDPRQFHISRSGIRIRTQTGKTGTQILFGKQVAGQLGAPPQAKPRPPIDRDAIPHYGKGRYPSTGADNARKQNEGLREGTHYLSPKGVKKYPEDEHKALAIDEKVMRRQMGLGWTAAGEKENLWHAGPRKRGKPRKRRRRKKKA